MTLGGATRAKALKRVVQSEQCVSLVKLGNQLEAIASQPHEVVMEALVDIEHADMNPLRTARETSLDLFPDDHPWLSLGVPTEEVERSIDCVWI